MVRRRKPATARPHPGIAHRREKTVIHPFSTCLNRETFSRCFIPSSLLRVSFFFFFFPPVLVRVPRTRLLTFILKKIFFIHAWRVLSRGKTLRSSRWGKGFALRCRSGGGGGGGGGIHLCMVFYSHYVPCPLW